jgi:hypothetical protein
MRAVADPVVTSVGSGSICPETEIVIPVTVSNCNGVAAISLALNFDNTRVSYQGYQNVNSAVSTMLVNQSNGTIYMTWANMSAVNLGDGTLVELRFNSTNVSGNANLNWNTSMCEYSDVTGTVLQASYYNGSVNVYAVPTITSNPNDLSLTEGQSSYFQLGASGQGVTYQWQIKTPVDNIWRDVIADSHHSNVNSYRLSVNNVTLEMDGNQYRCVVSGTCPSPVTSEVATLTVASYIPTIVTSLGSVTTCFDQVFSIPVNVTNCNNVGAISLVLNYDANLVTYMGYENANPELANGFMRVNAANGRVFFTWASSNQALQLGNGQLISFAFKSSAGNSNLTWNTSQCEYTNLAGNPLPTSYSGSTLYINYPPSITSHPSNQTVIEGANTSFSITASGNSLSYQWQMSQDQGFSWETLSNGDHYSSVTSRTLYVNNVVASMDGYRYRCLVNGSCDPAATSNYATLYVETQISNIVTTAGSLNTCSQNEFGIPISVINCNHVGAISLALSYNANVLTYTGYEGVNPALSNGQLQVNAANGMVFIAWASIQGANVGNGNLLTLNFAALSGTSSLSWNTNYCEFANTQGALFPATYHNGSVTVGDMSFTITSQPTNQAVTMGGNANFSVVTSGPTSGFQWQVSQDQSSSWSNVVAGDHYANPTTNTLTINNVPLEMNDYRFRCRISGDCGYQYTSVAILTVQLPPNYYQISLSADPEEGGTMEGAGAYMENTSCTVTAIPATGYDFVNWTENGTEVSTDAAYTFTVTTNRNLVAHFTLQEISINVSANPIGGGTINGGGTYLYGEHVLLTAIPITGSVFDNWTENDEVISTNQSISFTAQTDRTLVANFSVQQVNITATPVPASNGSIEGAGTYAYGSTVTLVAHAEQGFQLSTWTENGEVVGTSDTLSFIAENDRNLEANFITQQLHITAVADPEIGGTITGAGIYNYGDPVVLTATPVGNSEFLFWKEDEVIVSDQPTYSFNAYEHRNLVAHFYVTVTIAATAQPEGSGEISGTGTYNYTAPVTLTASPTTGFTFANWMERDTLYATTTSISFTAYTDRNFVVNFDTIMHHVNVSVNLAEAGTATGSGDYQEGSLALVSAVPNEHYEFVSWTENGVSVSTNPNYTFAVWGDRNLVANFSLVNFEVTATANPENGGTITGAGFYEEGETCTLTAIPSSNYTFINWTENGAQMSTESTYSFAVEGDRTLVANFYQDHPNTYIITTLVNPVGAGTVSGGGGYAMGSTCTLTATPAQGYFFINWTHNGNVVSTSPTYSFTVTGNANYIANFTLGLPDLHVKGITHSTFVGGQSATISWTVQNDGTAATPNGALWHDRVWLSVESRVAAGDNNPILLGTFDNLSALEPGEYYTQTQTFTLPLELSGSYYLFVLTDAYDCHTIYWGPEGVPLPYSPPPYIGCLSHHCPNCINVADNRIYELSEYEHGDAPGGFYNDNFFYTLVDIAVPPLPDLQVTGIIPPDNFFSGTIAGVTAYITNTGDHVTYSNHWADALFVASEPDINSPTAVCLDVKQHHVALGAGQSYQVILGGRVPITMYGEAYFFVYTDCYDQVYEHVMNHNNITMSNAVNIFLTPPADLIVLDVGTPGAVSTAENFTYSFRVKNDGAGSPNVGNWVDKVYLSTNPYALDSNALLLKTHSHHGKAIPGAYYTVSETVNLPAGIVSGNYYLYVHTDADNAVFEYLYDNNNVTRSSIIEVSQPDLQVAQASLPEQITSGYPLNLSYTLVNEGEGAIVNQSVTDKIFVSVSGSMADAIMIDSIRRNVSLPAGQSMTVMRNEVVPTGLTDGIYNLLIMTDFDNDINESEEGNNNYSHYPMAVFHQPLPDLQPVSLNLPSVIQAGEAVNVNFDITNIGDMDLLNSNCTFDVYAMMGEEEILCPVQSQTLPLGNYISIGINETLHFVRSVMVPPTVTSACTTFQLIANKGNQIMELDTTNNTFATNATVLDCPLPDLVVSNIVLPALQAGTETQVSFTVNNNGTAVFEGTFGTAIYTIYETDTVFCPMRLQLSPEANGNYVLAIGESMQFTQKILVPPSVTSSFNTFYVMVDAENIVLESNEDNNITSAVASVTNYPFNLTTQNFTVPSTVTAGELTPVSWTVKNIGTCPNEQIPFYIKNGNNYSLVNGEYLPTPWKDMILLSDDAVLSDDDVLLLSVDHNAVLSPNGTYQVQQNVVLPYNALGSKYLLCVSDSTQVTFDNNRVDNILAVPIEVELGVLPDLRITSLTVEPVLTSDNAYWVHYTVINEGERVTQRNNWTDAFYISETYAVTGAFQLGSKIHNGALEVGASYTDSIEILAPNGLEGDYFLLGFTDATNLIYEHENENDNVLATSVTVVAPDPCDLIAIQPEFPTSVASGEDMTVSWQLRNIGLNPATGRVRNAVYLSSDAEWSSDDKMLGYADMNIDIAANGEQSCELSGAITGFDEGSYYVIVKVNILNALNESTYENNICVSMLTTEITFPTLAIGETVQRTIFSEQNIYYKIEVGPEYEGQTMLCRLESFDHNLTVANGIYLSHGSVPTSIDFDYGQFVPYSYEQEIIIPALEQGTYYLMVQGAAFQMGNIHPINPIVNGRYLVLQQNISISTSIVNFEILSVNASHGSNTGSVTTKVTGAKFEDVMDFRLVRGDNYLPAQTVYVNNSSESYVTFDLTEMPLGTYTMEAELPGGVITVKEDAFTVEEGSPENLRLRLVLPASVRNGNTFPITLEYGNMGFTDLNVIGFRVVSRNGHPIGTTAEELQEGKTERIVYVRDGGTHYLNGMYPGFLNNKVLIMKATPSSNIKLSVYAIRRR